MSAFALLLGSAAGLPMPEAALNGRPPFRAPRHAASVAAVIGGGTAWMRPGEASLATASMRECHWMRRPL
jgi:magnesium chelatase family protein